MPPRLLATLLSTALLALVTAAVAAPAPLTFYVATNGNDLWSGRLATPNKARTDGPLSSLAGARDRIRAERIGNQPVQVLVRGGTYCPHAPFVLEPQDSGTAEAPVVHAAFQREKPVFSGGRAVTGFRQTGNLWETTIPEVKAGQWCFRQLSGVGIAPIGDSISPGRSESSESHTCAKAESRKQKW